MGGRETVWAAAARDVGEYGPVPVAAGSQRLIEPAFIHLARTCLAHSERRREVREGNTRPAWTRVPWRSSSERL